MSTTPPTMKFVTDVWKIIFWASKSSVEEYPEVYENVRSPSTWKVQFFWIAVV